MGKSYSVDLRDRIVAFVGQGHSRRAAARHFDVSASFSVKLLRRVAEYGTSAPARKGRPAGSGRLEQHSAFLIEAVEARPDMTMPELAALFEERHGITTAPSALSRFLCRKGFTYKKSPDGVGTRTRGCPGQPQDMD